MRSALRIGMVLVSAFLTGCFSYTPARGPIPRHVEAPAGPFEWPASDGTALEPLRDGTPVIIHHAKLLPDKTVEDLKNDETRELVTKPWYTVKRNEIVDGMLVRWYEKPEVFSGLDFFFTGFVANGSVLSPHDVSPLVWRLARLRAAASRAQINKVWATNGIEVDPTESDVGIDAGIPFRIPEEAPKDCKGIVLHLWALGGNDYEQAVAEEVRSRGWLVVDIKPRSGAAGEMSDGAPEKIAALDEERDALSQEFPHAEKGESRAHFQRRMEQSSAYTRFKDVLKESTELRNPAVPLCSESDVDAAAAELSARIDRALGENAAAARAVLETTRRVHPALRSSPVVVMGFSAGALSTPTVAALLGPDVNAVVIVGGAVNLLAVSQRSEVSKGGVRLLCEDKPPGKPLLESLERAYLAHSRLDGYFAAPHLADRPVLVVDAGMDTWVPSDLGEILYQRLGAPDRLHMALGGHEMLFYFLPRRSKWIADWVDAHALNDKAFTRIDASPSRSASEGPGPSAR